MNYQGVLRNQSDQPLSGTYDMVFRFMDAPTAGNEILVDQHTAATSIAVTVANGLFDVTLGAGAVSDGSGPGTYATLDAVFGDFANVWLEITVGGETLSPRTPIHSAAYALNATKLGGHASWDYLDTSSTTQQKTGELDFIGSSGSNVRIVPSALTGVGIWTLGGACGGLFQTNDPSSTGVSASGAQFGVNAEGGQIGGQFNGYDSTGATGVYATGSSYGVYGVGGFSGGYFRASNPGSNSTGVYGSGNALGGDFHGGPTGIKATGTQSGGVFTDAAGNSATLASGYGIIATSVGNQGSYFSNGSPYFAYTQIPYFDRGVYAYGSSYGGEFRAFSTGNYAQLATSSYKILGSGAVSFVQNHPDDPSKVIVYAAPEGDEVAVYTRGSGRLVHGEARVALGATFSKVTNPDIGLTATATPRGELIPLTVSEVSPAEIVVRGPDGSNADFDYMVWGLRIGFEETSIVQPKHDESKIPSMHQHEQFFADDPGLRKYTALARFEGVEEKVHGRKAPDLSRAERLKDAVGVSPWRAPEEMAHEPGRMPEPAQAPARAAAQAPVAAHALLQPGEERSSRPAPEPLPATSEEPAPAASGGAASDIVSSRGPDGLDRFVAEGPIATGDVVSLSSAAPGSVTRSAGPADALVIGCAQAGEGHSGATEGIGGSSKLLAVATSHIALCRVDASYGAIAVGDRLSPSPSAGLAMRLDPGAADAVVLGRAIEPLSSGTGLIRVLLGVR
ncbi:MAG TPA: hypothetical protein VFQ07_10665 [Candidatus Polarisedimenticolia bacterium]|nr:hypothetical protein [Candidatus Polarisedimenticolia bacterium]